ncbi:MAG: 4-hydroxy-tetrahydrodipicolinate synthase [Erysipelothrix sp.]|jgi:4-hydroxy-tetrahydrodipicolinate synthase|nr:4-hydroxy-tetrahydrodipicolinate synthase [Erysipelothrix sp.]
MFNGSAVAIVTPFLEDGVNFELFDELIERQITARTQAIIVCGSTGEAALMSLEEKQALIKRAVETSKKRILIIANTGTNNTAESIEFSRFAQEVGVDGLLIVAPYYVKPTQVGIVEHVKAIANAVQLPIILYNVPSRTGVNIVANTYHELIKIPNVVGVKEASSDLAQIKAIIDIVPPSFKVYSGNDDQAVDVIEMGGHGVISVSANLIPETIVRLNDLALSGNIEEARLLESSLARLHEVLFIESNPVPVKVALHARGFACSLVRLPLVPLSVESHVTLMETLKSYGLGIKI